MRYEIRLTPGAEEDLERLTIEMGRRVSHCLDLLEQSPTGPPARAMAGDLQGFYRMRAGDHRIIYSVDRERHVVMLQAVGPRSTIYPLVLRRLR